MRKRYKVVIAQSGKMDVRNKKQYILEKFRYRDYADNYNETSVKATVWKLYGAEKQGGIPYGESCQYALLRIMVDIVFRDVGSVPAYEFDFPVMLISLVVFMAIYEILMYVYYERIKKISIRQIPEFPLPDF